MAQATNTLSYLSAGAKRRQPIAAAPVPTNPAPAGDPVSALLANPLLDVRFKAGLESAEKNPMAAAHAALIAALLEEGATFVIRGGYADAEDITDRAEHLEHVLLAVAAYVDAVVDDTASNAVGIDRRIGGQVHDCAGDIPGQIMFALQHMEG